MKHLATPHSHHRRRPLTACEKQTATPSNCPVPPGRHPHTLRMAHRPTGVIGTEFQYRFFDSDGVDFICAGVSGEPFEVTVPLDEIGVMQYRDTWEQFSTGRSPGWLGTHLWLTTCQLRAYEVSLSVRPLPLPPILACKSEALLKMAAGSK